MVNYDRDLLLNGMDIKDLNKPQLILLALLISFVVSLATGIVTVSLMQQMPQSVPQTINNVIQRTIEKVTTVPVPVEQKGIIPSNGTTLVDIYPPLPAGENVNPDVVPDAFFVLGQGVVISDTGLILIDGTVVSRGEEHTVALGDTFYKAKLLKKFDNGLSMLMVVSKTKLKVPVEVNDTKVDTTN